MTDLLHAWVDGRLVSAGDATVSAYDVGFRNGEGVFETMRAYGAHPFRLDTHLERAVRGAGAIGFALDHGQLRTAVVTTVDANLAAMGGADSAVRLTASAGRIDPASTFPGTRTGQPTVVVTSHPLTPGPVGPATAVTVPVVRDLPEVKATSYLTAMHARRRARDSGADEALLTTPDGTVLEGASSNLFAVIDGRLLTPDVGEGLLAGVTRGVVLEAAERIGVPATLATLTTAALADADEAFLTASTRGVVPLVAVDGTQIGDGAPGQITSRLRQAYADEVERERDLGRGG